MNFTPCSCTQKLSSTRKRAPATAEILCSLSSTVVSTTRRFLPKQPSHFLLRVSGSPHVGHVNGSQCDAFLSCPVTASSAAAPAATITRGRARNTSYSRRPRQCCTAPGGNSPCGSQSVAFVTWHASRSKPAILQSCASSFPDAPTNGDFCRTSLRPGPSPTN